MVLYFHFITVHSFSISSAFNYFSFGFDSFSYSFVCQSKCSYCEEVILFDRFLVIGDFVFDFLNMKII